MMAFANDHATCILPWDSFRILPDGRMQYCDASLEKIKPDVKDTDLVSWWQSSETLQTARHKIRAGQELDGCSRCRHAESVDGVSFRTRRHFQAAIHHGQFFRDSLEQNVLWSSMQFDKIGYLPSHVNVSFSNDCNSRCIMCPPECSALVAEDHHDFGFLKAAPRPTQWWDSAEGEKKYQSLLKMVVENPRLLFLQVSGGEPFISVIVERFLQDIVDAGKTDFTLVINTNGTIWNDGIIDSIRKIDKCIIDFGIETASKANDYLRLGSSIEQVKNMIHRYQQLQDSKLQLLLHCVPQALSMPDFYTLINFCRANDLLLIGNPLFFPDHLSMTVLPWTIRQDIARDLMHRYQISPADLEGKVDQAKQTNITTPTEQHSSDVALPTYLNDIVIKMIKNLNQPEPADVRDLQIKLVDHVMRFDHKHGLEFAQSFPSLASFIKILSHA